MWILAAMGLGLGLGRLFPDLNYALDALIELRDLRFGEVTTPAG